MKVELNKLHHRLINDEGATSYPFECCGFLFGHAASDKRIIKAIRVQKNETGLEKLNRFLITPQAYKNAEKYAFDTAQELLGFYHSHPDCPAVPSQYDLDHAWPWYIYIILAVHSGKPTELNAWQLKDDRSAFGKVTIEINHSDE